MQLKVGYEDNRPNCRAVSVFKRKRKRFRRNKIWRFTECTTPYNRPSTTDSTATTATTATTAPTATTATTAIVGSTATTPATGRRRVLRDVSWSLGS